MSDYIKRDDVAKMLLDIGGCDAPAESWADGWDKAVITADKHLQEIPAADVVPVVHGRWIELGNCCTECSVCGDIRLGRSSQWYNGKLWRDAHYCGCCGARMDGEENV